MKKFTKILPVILIVISCDLLTTRTPEEPKRPSANFIPATQPERLFQNLKSAIEEKISENYMACFVDQLYLQKDFVFIPAIGVEIQYASFSDWNLQSERKYFEELKNKLGSSSNIEVIFNNITQFTRSGDSAVYLIDYNIPITSNNQSINGQYQGTAQFNIFEDSRGQWVIVKWR